MTLTFKGFDKEPDLVTDDPITEAGFSTMMQRLGELNNVHGVVSGFVASAGGGTRQVQVSAGAALAAPGVTADSNATESVTLDANSSGANRTDIVVLRTDWAANTVTVAVVKGSSAARPALTQVPGSVWEMPLARVRVTNGATTLVAGDITVCKPVPRRTIVIKGSVSAQSAGATTKTVGTINVPDPGWPYQLEAVGKVRCQQTNGTKAKLEAVDGDGNSIGSGISPDLSDVMQVGFTDVRGASYTDKATVSLQLSRFSGSGTIDGNAGNGTFYVKQIPA